MTNSPFATKQYLLLQFRTESNLVTYPASYGPYNFLNWLRSYLEYHTLRYLVLAGYQQLGGKWVKVFDEGEVHVINLDDQIETIYDKSVRYVFPDTGDTPLISRPITWSYYANQVNGIN